MAAPPPPLLAPRTNSHARLRLGPPNFHPQGMLVLCVHSAKKLKWQQRGVHPCKVGGQGPLLLLLCCWDHPDSLPINRQNILCKVRVCEMALCCGIQESLGLLVWASSALSCWGPPDTQGDANYEVFGVVG